MRWFLAPNGVILPKFVSAIYLTRAAQMLRSFPFILSVIGIIRIPYKSTLDISALYSLILRVLSIDILAILYMYMDSQSCIDLLSLSIDAVYTIIRCRHTP